MGAPSGRFAMSPPHQELVKRLAEINERPKCEYAVEPYWLDIAFPDVRLVIEVDGEIGHATNEQRTRDAQRDRWLDVHKDWTVFRTTGTEIMRQPRIVVDDIRLKLHKMRKQKQDIELATVQVVAPIPVSIPDKSHRGLFWIGGVVASLVLGVILMQHQPALPLPPPPPPPPAVMRTEVPNVVLPPWRPGLPTAPAAASSEKLVYGKEFGNIYHTNHHCKFGSMIINPVTIPLYEAHQRGRHLCKWCSQHKESDNG